MTSQDALAALTSLPPRRSVQELRDALGALNPGEPIRAVFKSDRYGVFAVDGLVRRGIAGDLAVGGHLLGNATRIEGDLLRVFTGVDAPVLPEAGHAGPAASTHGDIARAYVQHDAHGLVALTGVVTESDHDRFRLIGSWIVTDDGRFAPRVVGVERLTGADEQVLAVPRRRAHQDAVPTAGA